MRRLQRLRHRVRRIEKSLVHGFVLPHGRANLGAGSGRGQSVGCQLHRAVASRQIAAGLRHAAAGILDKRPDYKIRPDRARLPLFRKLAVAVIHDHEGVRRMCPHERHKPADLLHGQRSAVEVALGTLDEHHFQMPRVLPHLGFNARPVKATLRGQLHRVVADSEIAQ